MTFDCTIEHTARKENYIANAPSRINKYLSVSTTRDNFIRYCVDSATIKPLREIRNNHISISNHATTSAPTSDHLCNNIPPSLAINFTHVDCDFNTCRGIADTDGHHHSYSHLDEEEMKLTSEDDYDIITKQGKVVSSNEALLSSIPD